ncbi:thioesterase II family protein [Providencia burhodogranariea]|uniref:Pyochelin biosynthetic protein PchC n=1 Tax=Providencia burhodogranariea DSM 19968 TaxID=1141662 RepID=K8VZR6_9GAMM|nr:alpha/beta fold hydrolase [Providencia burhodogranariea]EKT53046.1 pyochelin biosynthetic protein PchC [Providencia burhodogranariea DSM 19968]
MKPLISYNRTVMRFSQYGVEPVEKQLVVFPHAGGSAAFYQPWRERLSAKCDLLVVQYPNREERHGEEPWQGAEEAITACSHGLREVLGIAPITFFGHSMGALLALQVAMTLWDSRFSCRRLVLSSQRVPAELLMLQQYASCQQLLDRILSYSEDTGIMHLDDLTRQIVAGHILQDLTLLGQLAELPVADIPLRIIGGEDDPLVGETEREGWSALVTECQQSSWPGGHFYFQQDLDAFLSELLQ